MCEYCEMVQDVRDTWHNNNQTIGEIREGNLAYICKLWRYVDYDKGVHTGELVLEEVITVGEVEEYDVQQKIIPIKYCPFCGEKL